MSNATDQDKLKFMAAQCRTAEREIDRLQAELKAAWALIHKHNDWIENNDDVQQRCYIIK